MRCLPYKTAFTALRLQKRSGVNTLSIEFCFIAVSIQSDQIKISVGIARIAARAMFYR